MRGNVSHMANIDIKNAGDEKLLVSSTKIGRTKTKFLYKDPTKPRNMDEKFLQDLLTNPEYEEQRQVLKKVTKIKKGGTDTSAPSTYYMRRTGSAKPDMHAAMEH